MGGPVEMGKIKGYKGTKLEYNSESETDDNMLVEKTHIVIKKKWGVSNLKNININDDLYDDDESESAYDSEQQIETPKSAKLGTPKSRKRRKKKSKKEKKQKKKKN